MFSKKQKKSLEDKALNGILFLEIVTKGELYEKRKSPQSARSTIAKHARDTYISSGKPLCCCVCGYNKHTEICHIKAVSDFTNESFIGEINDIDNLMALCPNHHWEFDNNLLEL